MGKRRRSSSGFLLCDETPDLTIYCADKAEPILAHIDVLRLCSGVVRDLPRAARAAPGLEPAAPTPTVWDLRGLVLEGDQQPVSSAVVSQWLDLVYSRVDSGRRCKLSPSLDDSRQLLLFCDASATSDLVMSDLGQQLAALPGLRLDVPLPCPQPCLQLVLSGRVYAASAAEGVTCTPVPASGCRVELMAPEAYALHRRALPRAACATIEAWLYLASRLQITALVEMLVEFVRTQLLPNSRSILQPQVARVYSPRVLQTLPPAILFDGFLRHALLHRPSDLRIASMGPVMAAVQSPLAAAASFAVPPPHGGNAIKNVALCPSTSRTRLRGGASGVELTAVNATLGGPDAETTDKLVRAAVAAAVSEA
ncbi:hypothetical protein HYH03_005514 [Edaphochlamys debaryana]|uniref:Uncharacterized protein n=1 Tax=Edaphochlamys debaryana TaxID=47281 RepID=A0A835Y8R0_9CHLO|nr:hypothetical protein HYH03_005514 [Edaphochlamys debaryana]|eukprot:KAG2496281.1 hypothetical protein HYH03_005514 [Edaphochlamys debaryana]